jgi:hypothetical protein
MRARVALLFKLILWIFISCQFRCKPSNLREFEKPLIPPLEVDLQKASTYSHADIMGPWECKGSIGKQRVTNERQHEHMHKESKTEGEMKK